jgi:hypothetical protein
MRHTIAFTPLVVVGIMCSGCNKPTPATADSASASSTSSGAFNEQGTISDSTA